MIDQQNQKIELEGDVDLSELTECESIGQLQHDMKILSIKLLEKDMEIRNLKAGIASANSVEAVSFANLLPHLIKLKLLKCAWSLFSFFLTFFVFNWFVYNY